VILLAERMSLVQHVADIKVRDGLATRQPERERLMIRKRCELARKNGINPDFMEKIFRLIIEESCKVQEARVEELVRDGIKKGTKD